MGDTDLFFGRNVFEEALKQKIPITEIFCASGDARRLVESLLKDAGLSFRISSAFPKELAPHSHQGVAFRSRYKLYTEEPPPEELSKQFGRVLLCNHLEDIQNLGSLARSAAAFGFSLIVHERRRSVRMNPVGVKISAGQAFRVRFLEVGNLAPFCRNLKEEGFQLAGLDAQNSSISIYKFEASSDRLGLVVGSEASGISKPVRNELDVLVSIPMAQGVESLNASQAAALAMGWIFGKPA